MQNFSTLSHKIAFIDKMAALKSPPEVFFHILKLWKGKMTYSYITFENFLEFLSFETLPKIQKLEVVFLALFCYLTPIYPRKRGLCWPRMLP